MTEEDMLQTAQDYRRQAQKSSAHYRMCEIANRRNIAFGVPAAILSTAVGTAIFSNLTALSQSSRIKICARLFSLLAAILVSLQTFFNFADVAVLETIMCSARHGDLGDEPSR